MKSFLLRIIFAVALVALTGCTTPIGADRVTPRAAFEKLQENALNSANISSDARRVLNRFGLDEAFKKNPDATLETLQTIACQDDRRDIIFALSELSFWNAERQSRSVKPGVPRGARDAYFASAIYAYLYLLGESQDARPNPFDLRFRTAGNLYNRGLALGLMANTNALVKLESGPRQLFPGTVAVQFTQPGFPWSLDVIKEFYSADEFVVRGLSTRNRNSGLGAPLIAVTKEFGKFNESVRAPATVFLRVQGGVREWSAGTMSATLELYSAFDTSHVEINGRQVPLQTDTTVPIAQGLNNSPVWKLGIAQFFSAELQNKTGIRRMEPYTPGQIPVVFVHGTASSPVWWAEMWNTLNADPVLRKRYQFWMFNYASGKPITMSAGILRDDLMKQVKTLDPEGKDPGLQHMVVIGHSQGGLLAKLTATDTGDKLWQIVSKTNLDALNIDVPTRELLRSNFFFKALPCVSRVIFISTPHRGSYQNTSLVQNILNRFMSFPSDLMEASANLMKLKDTINLPPSVRKGVPSSLNGMATDNPFMLTLADIPVAPGIKANSIIAINGDEQPPEGADGVVKYTSAHVDYAESEFIVRSGHSCQDKPPTIEEVRRILLKNLADAKATP